MGKTKFKVPTLRRALVVLPGLLVGSPDRVEVDGCVECGAVVFDPIQHHTWHRAAEQSDTFVPSVKQGESDG